MERNMKNKMYTHTHMYIIHIYVMNDCVVYQKLT